MAENKFGDLAFAVVFGLFFLGMFFAVFTSFDEKYTTDDYISGELNTIYTNSSDKYELSETQLQQDTFNQSAFSITAGSDIDVRGTSQAILVTRNSPSIMTTFWTSSTKYLFAHKYVVSFVAGIIIITGIILLMRFLRPGGA